MAFSLKDYSNLERIGSGGMGNVYSAIQRSLGRKVAIKEMSIAFQDDSTLVKSFENEARFAASLDHANVIRIYDFGEDNGSFFIAMEFIDGYTLEELLSWNPFLKEIGLLIMLQALKGLHFAHSRKIAHCDIKPNNILISKTGRVIVTDFGIANASAYARSRMPSKKMLVTPAYIPPEQAVHVQEQVMSRDSTIDTIPVFVSDASTAQIPDLDFRKDIWSVGVLLYRILSGKLPFSGPTTMATVLAIQRGALPSIRSSTPTLPDQLAASIDSCLIKEPRKRLSSFEPLINELQNLTFDYGFRDSEREIQRFLADNSAYASAIEKDLIDYHVRKGNEFKASGETQKSKVHFDAAKQIVFDPSKKDQPITLFPWQTQSKLPVQEESKKGISDFVLKKVALLKKTLTPKRIKMVAAGLLILIALCFGITLTVSIIQRIIVSQEAPDPVLSLQDEQRTLADAGTSNPQTQSPSPSVTPDNASQDTLTRSMTYDKSNTPNRALIQKTREMRKTFNVAESTEQKKPRMTKQKGSTPSSTLVVTVDPSFAYVFVDESGIPRQELASGKVLSTGPHVISAIADGYQTYKEAVMLMEDSTVTLNIVLKRAASGNGFLHIYCYPWAELYIDGSFQGQAPTPNPLPLPEGTHSIRLRREGFKTYLENIEITAGEEKRIQIEMEKE